MTAPRCAQDAPKRATWPQLAAQVARKSCQDGSKMAQTSPKTATRPQLAAQVTPRQPKTPKMPQDAQAQADRDVRPFCPQESSKTSQESPRSIFGRFLLDFGLIVGRLFIDFGSIFNMISMQFAFKKQPLELKNQLNSFGQAIIFCSALVVPERRLSLIFASFLKK